MEACLSVCFRDHGNEVVMFPQGFKSVGIEGLRFL